MAGARLARLSVGANRPASRRAVARRKNPTTGSCRGPSDSRKQLEQDIALHVTPIGFAPFLLFAILGGLCWHDLWRRCRCWLPKYSILILSPLNVAGKVWLSVKAWRLDADMAEFLRLLMIWYCCLVWLLWMNCSFPAMSGLVWKRESLQIRRNFCLLRTSQYARLCSLLCRNDD